MNHKVSKYTIKSLEAVRKYIKFGGAGDEPLPDKYALKLEEYNVKLPNGALVIESYKTLLSSNNIDFDMLNKFLYVLYAYQSDIALREPSIDLIANIYFDALISCLLSSYNNKSINTRLFGELTKVIALKFINKINNSSKFPLALKLSKGRNPIDAIVSLLSNKSKKIIQMNEPVILRKLDELTKRSKFVQQGGTITEKIKIVTELNNETITTILDIHKLFNNKLLSVEQSLYLNKLLPPKQGGRLRLQRGGTKEEDKLKHDIAMNKIVISILTSIVDCAINNSDATKINSDFESLNKLNNAYDTSQEASRDENAILTAAATEKKVDPAALLRSAADETPVTPLTPETPTPPETDETAATTSPPSPETPASDESNTQLVQTVDASYTPLYHLRSDTASAIPLYIQSSYNVPAEELKKFTPNYLTPESQNTAGYEMFYRFLGEKDLTAHENYEDDVQMFLKDIIEHPIRNMENEVEFDVMADTIQNHMTYLYKTNNMSKYTDTIMVINDQLDEIIREYYDEITKNTNVIEYSGKYDVAVQLKNQILEIFGFVLDDAKKEEPTKP